MSNPRIVLASTSSWRRDILARLGLPFTCQAPICDETPHQGEAPSDTASRLARCKAQSLADPFPNALIIGADQVAELDGQHIGKPGSLEQAVAMLQQMGGRQIAFYTALTLYNSKTGQLQQHIDHTRVTMRRLTEPQIRQYLAREPDALFCAGAAKSEGLGGALIDSIESHDPNALIGLPLFALVGMLAQEGVSPL